MKKVGIVGVGLIGGSIALALKNKYKDKVYIYGYDLNKEHIRKAKEVGAIDECFEEGAQVVQSSDLIIVATPLDKVKEVFQYIAKHQTPDKVVTDVCSLKMKVHKLAETILPYPENFIGGHPMAGSEKGGFDAAHHEIFIGKPYIITPVENTSEMAISEVHWLIKSLGAKPVTLTPEEHDYAVAYNSHLTHVISWAIVSMALKDRTADIAARFGGPSYRDMTRVSMSSPSLWSLILSENKDKVSKAIDLCIKEIISLKSAIESGSREEIEKIIKPARDKRFEIYRASEAKGKIFRLEVVLPNKPGQLAKVTALFGQQGINIENIEMVHGEGQGLLFVDVCGEENAERALSILQAAGFEATISQDG
ncbi:MAG: prephenate dehydrogenase/arogenate dehydrogenase family protein [Actinobacteria bacterium]|nr:prephenate dehydrogenase/arogenate dehydrogenase family protein [Actinomycetota bacterium]